MSNVTRLDVYRANRDAALTPPPPGHHHLAAAPDRVVIAFANGYEVDLSPARARVWAERLLAMADVAEGLARDERALLEPGGDDAG